jgi:hypothetical protein
MNVPKSKKYAAEQSTKSIFSGFGLYQTLFVSAGPMPLA